MRSIAIWLFLAALPFASLYKSRDIRVDGLDFDAQRQVMVDKIATIAELSHGDLGIETIDARILNAMRNIPRHEFVAAELRPFAYLETPLPVGFGQNLASPFLVALMTQLAEIKPEDTVFETGTGAGYHAALLARLSREVYSVEVVTELVDQARTNVSKSGQSNIHIRSGDGYYGWPDAAPFDAILVKEALDHLPAPLIDQLKPGGRMVAPIGPHKGPQDLQVIRKDADGTLIRRSVMQVIFTPLQGGDRI